MNTEPITPQIIGPRVEKQGLMSNVKNYVNETTRLKESLSQLDQIKEDEKLAQRNMDNKGSRLDIKA